MCFAAPLSGVWCAAFISCCLRRDFFSFLDVKKEKKVVQKCRLSVLEVLYESEIQKIALVNSKNNYADDCLIANKERR